MNLSDAHMIVLRDINRRCSPACPKSPVDLRVVGEAYRQKAIDLGMMEPPLVDVRGDYLITTAAGIFMASNAHATVTQDKRHD